MGPVALLLLPQHMELCSLLHDDAIRGVGFTWENADNSMSLELLVIDDVFEHRLCVVPEFLGLCASLWIVEDLWVVTVGVLPADLPCAEEGEPVDIGQQ